MKILLAVDGSKSSECVINELARINLKKEDEILLYAVIESATPMIGEPFVGIAIEYQAEIEKQSRKAAHEAIEKAIAKIRTRFDGNIQSLIASGGPKYSIVEKARDWKADLIIIGSHGYPLWERILLGSVSSFVSQHADCSVLIARCREGA